MSRIQKLVRYKRRIREGCENTLTEYEKRAWRETPSERKRRKRLERARH